MDSTRRNGATSEKESLTQREDLADKIESLVMSFMKDKRCLGIDQHQHQWPPSVQADPAVPEEKPESYTLRCRGPKHKALNPRTISLPAAN